MYYRLLNNHGEQLLVFVCNFKPCRKRVFELKMVDVELLLLTVTSCLIPSLIQKFPGDLLTSTKLGMEKDMTWVIGEWWFVTLS